MALALPALNELSAAIGPPWSLVESAAHLAWELGFELYLVGGPVRDLLLGQPSEDLDLLVDGHGRVAAPELGRRMHEVHGGRLTVYEAFHTATWISEEGQELDFATARTEHYAAPAALPEVTPADLEADLGRRDLSINAMALRLRDGALVDPFGGLEDLAAGRLRALHPRSFHDDPTRALRAARYAARYGFELTTDSRHWLSEAVESGAFEHLGHERLGHELHHLLHEPAARQALELACRWRTLSHLGLRWEDTLARRLDALDQTEGEAAHREQARWLVLAGALARRQRLDCERLVNEGHDALDRWRRGLEPVLDAIGELPLFNSYGSQVARLLGELDEVELFAARALACTPGSKAAIRWWQEEGQRVRSVVDARGLMERGMQPGPALGEALRQAQEAAWDGLDEAAQWKAALGRNRPA